MAGNRNSGRRPQPTALKVLRGNPSKTRLNEAEPQPPDGNVVQPATLSAQGAVIWGEIAPVATAMGTLTVADVWAFSRLCELEAMARATAGVKDNGELFRVKSERDGDVVVTIDDVVATEVKLANALRPYYEKFGLEPSGRSRIKVPKDKAPESKWAKLIG